MKHDDEQVPLLATDYEFIGGAAFLAIKDRHTKVLWSNMVPNKGLEPNLYGGEVLLVAIEQTGYKRLILKSDKEPAILSVCACAKAQFAGEILPEAPPAEGHEFSNGLAERAVGMCTAHARNLREFVEFRLKQKIPDNRPMLAWMVDYAGTLIRLFSKGKPHDGLTPMQRLKGKPWRVALPPFCEKVEYRRRTTNKFEGRWRPGIYVGVRCQTTERIIGDPEGTCIVQSVRRVPVKVEGIRNLL